MTPDTKLGTMDSSELLNRKIHLLPNNIYKYLSLKKPEELKAIISFSEPPLNEARNAKQKVEDMLNTNVKTLLFDGDRGHQALSAFRLAWLLFGTHDLTNEQKLSDINQTYEIWTDQEDTLEAKAKSIVVEISKLTKEAANF